MPPEDQKELVNLSIASKTPKWLPLALAFLMVLIIVLCSYFYQKYYPFYKGLYIVNQYSNNQKEISKNSPSVTDIEFANWKTYHNDEYGFEIKYPGDWDFATIQQDVFKIDLVFKSPSSNTIEFILNNEEVFPCEEDCISNHTQFISGNNWTIYDLKYYNQLGKAAIIKKNNLYFLLSSSKEVDFNSQKFDQILSTFKFIK